MKFNNLDELLKAFMVNSNDWTITVVDNWNDQYTELTKEEPHHITDNFNKQQQAG
jgi:hypothetical protein